MHSMASLDQLTPYDRNARTHSEAQVTQIAASISEFGFTNPILVDAGFNIIAGHGRAQAARQLGLTEVPVIILSHLTETQRRAYVLADNKLALNAGWDDALLKLELGELQVEGFNLELTGFSEMEIDLLDAPDNAPPEDEWQGMPEFEQPSIQSFKSIVIHFRDPDAIAEFAALIGQTIGAKTRFTWFPYEERGVFEDKRYANDS